MPTDAPLFLLWTRQNSPRARALLPLPSSRRPTSVPNALDFRAASSQGNEEGPQRTLTSLRRYTAIAIQCEDNSDDSIWDCAVVMHVRASGGLLGGSSDTSAEFVAQVRLRGVWPPSFQLSSSLQFCHGGAGHTLVASHGVGVHWRHCGGLLLLPQKFDWCSYRERPFACCGRRCRRGEFEE